MRSGHRLPIDRSRPLQSCLPPGRKTSGANCIESCVCARARAPERSGHGGEEKIRNPRRPAHIKLSRLH
jgi:hypothetical protein